MDTDQPDHTTNAHTTETMPLPPLADSSVIDHPLKGYVKLYQELGPIFRIPKTSSDNVYQRLGSMFYAPKESDDTLTVLAGPEGNTFATRALSTYLSPNAGRESAANGKNEQLVFDQSLQIEVSREVHRRMRAVQAPGYSRNMVLDRLPHMVEITQSIIDTWQLDQSIPIVENMRRITSEQIGQLLLHHSPANYLADLNRYFDIAESRINYIDDLVHYFSPPVTQPGVDQGQGQAETPSDQTVRQEMRSKERSFEFARAVIEEHRATPLTERHSDLVDILLEVTTQYPGVISEDGLALLTLSALFAGTDTVAKTSGFLLYALHKNPEVLEQVREEADQLLREPLTWDRLKAAQVLHRAAMETQRMYPVACGHLTFATQPFVFAGHRVERGEQVLVAMTVSHYLPQLFPEPERFDIDRYKEPRNEHRQPGAYAPFGLGEYSCLGSSIAEIQLMVIAATALRHCQFEIDPPDYIPDAQPYTFKPEVPTLSPGSDFRLRLTSNRIQA
jgi:cytochrome P450